MRSWAKVSFGEALSCTKATSVQLKLLVLPTVLHMSCYKIPLHICIFAQIQIHANTMTMYTWAGARHTNTNENSILILVVLKDQTLDVRYQRWSLKSAVLVRMREVPGFFGGGTNWPLFTNIQDLLRQPGRQAPRRGWSLPFGKYIFHQIIHRLLTHPDPQ